MTTSPVRFRAACIKTLSAVEADLSRSHQHELNGVRALKEMLGEEGFESEAIFSVRGSRGEVRQWVTWYDAREAHETRTEHRLYFSENDVMDLAEEGDQIVVGYDERGNLRIELIKAAGVAELISEWRAL